ncbi:thymidylate kinase [Aeromonas phage AerS_266]|nr:thymidylate kinase [Aeromonas phage AerS_266]
MYIAIEGLDFSGKSTLAKIIAKEMNARLTMEPFCETEESKAFKAKLCSNTMTKDEEIQGYGLARVQTFKNVIIPCKEQGQNVISDRNFITSMVYQSCDEISLSHIFNFNKKLLASQGYDILPDLIIFIDITHDEFLTRLEDAQTNGREVNAKDLMFKDQEVFDLYRSKYLRSLAYLSDNFNVAIKIVNSKENTFEHFKDLIE